MIKLSIIIPAHNEEVFITGLLRSIEAHLQIDHEIIVVNNGSSDNTEKVAAIYNCKIINISDKVSPSKARNIGTKSATGNFFVFLDADVEITEEWGLEVKKVISTTDPEAYILTGESYIISKEPSFIELYWFDPLRKKEKTYINGGNIIITKRFFETLNGFDESRETGEDVDFCLRATQAGGELIFNSALKVHHEGFPQTIFQFIKREKWHGTDDFLTLNKIFNSKVAIITCIFIFLHFASFLIISTHSLISPIFLNVFFVMLLSILVICLISSAASFRLSNSRKYILTGTLIYYLYFIGRSLSAITSLTHRLKKISSS